jgi:hypothetical protein
MMKKLKLLVDHVDVQAQVYRREKIYVYQAKD